MRYTSPTLFAFNYSYSFVHLQRFEAWLGAGLNTQALETSVLVDVGGGGAQRFEEEAKATVPIPTFNFGMRYDFSRRLRMLATQELFGLQVGDYSGSIERYIPLRKHQCDYLALVELWGFGPGER